MKIAVIDLGTNTFNLYIAKKLQNGKIEDIVKIKRPVKLGEGGVHKGIITEQATLRALAALTEYKNIIDEHTVIKTIALATSAVRDAKNQVEFIDLIKAKTGIEVQIIDGKREAELIYKGIKKAVTINQKSLLMDIGGGSTEFIIANEKGIIWSKSFQLGVARLKGLFSPSEPIKQSEINKINEHLQHILNDLIIEVKKHNISVLIGSSGTFDSFADMIDDLKNQNQTTTAISRQIEKSKILNIQSDLEKTTEAQRLQIKALPEMRAPYIVLGGLIVKFVIESFNIQQIFVSDYALREGLISELFES